MPAPPPESDDAIVRQRELTPTPPFAGTTRIRFDGCDLSPEGHPGREASIDVVGDARYDGLAEWYDAFDVGRYGRPRTTPSWRSPAARTRAAARSRLRHGRASAALALAAGRWPASTCRRTSSGSRASVSRCRARPRGRGRAAVRDESFDAASSTFTHTDFDDFAGRRCAGHGRAFPSHPLVATRSDVPRPSGYRPGGRAGRQRRRGTLLRRAGHSCSAVLRLAAQSSRRSVATAAVPGTANDRARAG